MAIIASSGERRAPWRLGVPCDKTCRAQVMRTAESQLSRVDDGVSSVLPSVPGYCRPLPVYQWYVHWTPATVGTRAGKAAFRRALRFWVE